MAERARLYALALRHFPELLSADSVWVERVGLSAGLDSVVLRQRGLFADGRTMSAFKVLLSVRRVCKVVDEEGREWAIKQFDLGMVDAAKRFYRCVCCLMMMIMMMMMIISPFGYLGLWAPSSGVRDV